MEINKLKHIKSYLWKLDSLRNTFSINKLNPAKTFFNAGLYDLAIHDIKKYMNISTSIGISVRKKTLPEKVGAQISIPHNLYGMPGAFTHRYFIYISHSAFKDFDVFVMLIVHELSHLKLFLNMISIKSNGENIPLWNIEKAVDTLGIISGFGDYYYRSHRYSIMNSTEYINRQEFEFIYSCFKSNKRFKSVSKQLKKKKKPFWKRLFRI